MGKNTLSVLNFAEGSLKCILNPQMLIDVNRSQNRIESYHTLRSAIAKVGGRKALLGR